MALPERQKVRTTTVLGDTPGFGPVTMEWPIDWFDGQSVSSLIYHWDKITLERDDGTVVTYERIKS